MVALIPSGLFTILRRMRSEVRTPEQTYRSFLFSKIVVHMDTIRDDLGTKWPAFAEELQIRLEPIILSKAPEVTLHTISSAADAIIDQCKGWPDIGEYIMHLVKVVEELLPNMSLPNDFRVKQDLLTNFYRLHDWILKDKDQKLLMSDSSRSSSSSNTSTSNNSNGSTDSSQGFIEVPVMYVTCRKPTGSQLSEAFFGTERGDAISYGFVKVSIPDTDNMAQTRQELPYFWWWDRVRPSHQNKKRALVGKVMGICEEYATYNTIRCMNRLGEGRREACVYVHGFNTRFVKAAKKMALCGYKMQAEAPLFMFSWPSYQSVDRYNADEGNAMWAVQHLIDFLWKMLTEMEMEKVHLIGHSMGSRIILYALARLGERTFPEGAAKLGRLVLAAPDFDLGEFYLMQDHLSKTMEHITIYSSANDQALHVSKRIHGGQPRLGEFPINAGSRPWHVAFNDNIDLIDATGLDRSVIGHGYVFSHAGVLRDACDFLRSGLPAGKRPAVRSTILTDGFRHYTFQGITDAPSAIEEEEMDDLDEDEALESIAA